MSKTPIVFFGTGPVAARSLELLASDFDIVAVITKPLPEHHRGDYPVIETSEKLGLPMHFAAGKAELSELMATQSFGVDAAILVDFGIIVTQDVIDRFPRGIINSHFSLLPEWRGADPITFAILSGQKKTGVSLMLIDEGMDTGKIIRQKSLSISDDETTPSLTEKLIGLSDNMLKEDIPDYLNGNLLARSQPHPDRATYSRKITKEDGILDFDKPAEVLEREVRAFIEWPKSRTRLADIDVIITSASVTGSTVNDPGLIDVFSDLDRIIIHCGKDALAVEKLKPAGKSEMTAKAFLAGYGSRII